MPGIINNHFRKYNAGNFIEAFGETNPDVIYLFIGKNDAWSGTSEGEYAGTASCPTPPKGPRPQQTTHTGTALSTLRRGEWQL